MYWASLLVLLFPFGAPASVSTDDLLKQELQQFQGSWKAVAIHNADGRQSTKEEIDSTRLSVVGNKFTLTGEKFSVTGTFAVDPTKSPKTIDVLLTSKEGRETKVLGIYEIRGDIRKSCFTLGESERPRQFTMAKGYFGFEWKKN